MHRFTVWPAALLFSCYATALVSCASTPPATPPPPEVALDCPAGEWCWVRGQPQRALGGGSIDTVYALGPAGSFLRWRDGGWEAQPVPTRAGLTSGWVFDDAEAWASDTEGRAWQRTDGAWHDRSPGRGVVRLHGTSDGDIFAEVGGAVGGHGANVSGAGLVRWDGAAWMDAAPIPEYCLGGVYLPLARDEIWSAGLTCNAGGQVETVEVRRFDGASWTLVGEPFPNQAWYPSFGRFTDTVRIRAQGWFEWTGTTWAAIEGARYPQVLERDETAAEDSIGYTRFPRSLGCTRAWRLDASHAWCFGAGQIHYRAADGWRPTLPDPFVTTRAATEHADLSPMLWAGADTVSAWGSGPNDHYRVRGADRALERYDGHAWHALGIESVRDLDGAGPRDLWLATDEGLLRWQAGEVTRVELASSPARVVALDRDRALVAVDGQILRVGTTVDVIYTAPAEWTVIDVAATRDGDVWATVQEPLSRAPAGVTLRFDGEWREVAPFAGQLATDGDTAWLLAPRDDALHRLTGPARRVPIPVRAYDFHPWASAGDVWLTSPRQALRWAGE